MHDDRQLSGNRDACLLRAGAFGELHTPRPNRRPLLGSPQVRIRRFKERVPHEFVPALANVAGAINLTRLINARRQPEGAATAFESLNRPGSSIVALNNKLTIGPTPETVISRYRTNTEHLATILLPNPVAAYDTSRYRMDRRRKNPQIKQDVAQLAATG
jgi:hypothetical protein